MTGEHAAFGLKFLVSFSVFTLVRFYLLGAIYG